MNPLTPIENGLTWVLDRLHENVGLTYGWSIVVLVLLVRAALLPLVIKQYRSLRQMQVVAPQLKEIQRKYKGDKKKQQEELMRFYQENQINPFSSCLPMLAQLPVFFALYYVLKDFAEDAGDDTNLGFMGVIPNITMDVGDLALWSTVIIALIYGLSQLLSSELSFEPHTPDTQRRIMRFLPIVVVIGAFQFPFPAGLAIYWVTSNLWTAGQQLVIRHKIGLHIAEHPEETGPRTSRTPSKAERAAGAAEETPASGGGRRSRRQAAAAVAEDGETPEERDTAPTGEASPPATTVPPAGNGGAPPRRKPRPHGGSGSRGGQRRTPKKRR